MKETEGQDAIPTRVLRIVPDPIESECADPEILAAYQANNLADAEREPLQSHIAECTHCEGIVAAIAYVENAQRSQARQRRSVLFRLIAIVAPIAAVGVLLALLIGIRRRAQSKPEIALASRRLPANSRIEAVTHTDVPLAPQAQAPLAKRSVAAPQVQVQAPAAKASVSNDALAAVAHGAASTPATAREERLTRGEIVAEKAAAAEHRVESMLQRKAPAIPLPASPRAKNQSASLPQPNAANSPAGSATSDALSSPAAAGAAIAALESRAYSIPRQAPAPIASPAKSGGTLLPDDQQFFSPDRRVGWWIGADGAVMRTTTAEKSRLLPTGITADLLAGSAPSAAVCWVVGKSGTIIRTLNGGDRWEVVDSPTEQNLLRVSAEDSVNVRIVDANGQQFSTNDAGVTWSSP